MTRLTEYHGGVAVIKDKRFKEAAEKLAAIEDAFEAGVALTCPTLESQKALSEILRRGRENKAKREGGGSDE